MFDLDSDGKLTSAEMQRALLEVYGSGGGSSANKNAAIDKFMRMAAHNGTDPRYPAYLDRRQFEEYVKSYPTLIFPVHSLQRRLQEVTGGAAFWKRLTERRRRRLLATGAKSFDYRDWRGLIAQIGVPSPKSAAKYVLSPTSGDARSKGLTEEEAKLAPRTSVRDGAAAGAAAGTAMGAADTGDADAMLSETARRGGPDDRQSPPGSARRSSAAAPPNSARRSMAAGPPLSARKSGVVGGALSARKSGAAGAVVTPSTDDKDLTFDVPDGLATALPTLSPADAVKIEVFGSAADRRQVAAARGHLDAEAQARVERRRRKSVADNLATIERVTGQPAADAARIAAASLHDHSERSPSRGGARRDRDGTSPSSVEQSSADDAAVGFSEAPSAAVAMAVRANRGQRGMFDSSPGAAPSRPPAAAENRNRRGSLSSPTVPRHIAVPGASSRPGPPLGSPVSPSGGLPPVRGPRRVSVTSPAAGLASPGGGGNFSPAFQPSGPAGGSGRPGGAPPPSGGPAAGPTASPGGGPSRRVRRTSALF